MKNLHFLGAALLLSACGGQAPQGPPSGPPQVRFVEVREQPVTLTSELPGRTAAFETSEVRPQVNGLVLQRLFTEGEQVRAGQPLYRIDPQPYQAQAASARAALARARASIASSQALARRYGELVRINAVARQDYENATTGAQQAQADVAAQQAAVTSAQINLTRTTVTAPISGRIGRSISTTGALVTAQQADPLTTIQRLDPIYVDLSQSSADILKLRQQALAGQLNRSGSGAARVRLTLEDGTLYPIEGTLQFADVSVDPTTGSQTIRAVFANPRGLLLPGMFVRAALVDGTQRNAILVSQRAVSRDERGNPTALVVGQDGKVQLRKLTAPRTIGSDWLVTAGLKSGDRVIVEGGQNLQPGAAVKATRWTEAAATPRRPSAGLPANGADASGQAR